MDSWKLNSYKEEHLEREDLGKILTQLNPPILCHPFLHPFSLMSWEIFIWTHKKRDRLEIQERLTQDIQNSFLLWADGRV